MEETKEQPISNKNTEDIELTKDFKELSLNSKEESTKRIITGDFNGNVKIWSKMEDVPINRKNISNSSIISSTHIDNLGIFGSKNGDVITYDIERAEIINEHRAHKSAIHDILLVDNHIIITASQDRSIKIWDVRENMGNIGNIGDVNCEHIHMHTLTGHCNRVLTLGFIAGNDGFPPLLMSGGYDYLLKFWNLDLQYLQSQSRPKCLGTLCDHSDYVTGVVQLSPILLATSSFNGELKLWEINEGIIICSKTIYPKVVNNYISKPLLPLSSGTSLAVASEYNVIRLYDYSDLTKPPRILKIHKNYILRMAQLDEDHLVSSSADNTIKIWNIQNLECEKTLQTDSSPITMFIY